jgi:hypothetical protein
MDKTGEPISAPADTWTWVDFPESHCASGTPTGIAVRLHPQSDRVMIFLEGGGSCTTGNSCFGSSPTATNTAGYGAADFKTETKLDMLSLFQTKAGNGNPFAEMNMVFVPYCTGDGHGGTLKQSLTLKDGTKKDAHFWGGKNMDLFLDRLVPTFDGLKRVYLTGSSAGGAGTLLNYGKVREAFAVRVDVVNDSSPPFDGGEATYAAAAALWGIQPPTGCSNCVDGFSTYKFNRGLDPASRSALMSFQYDSTIAANHGIPLADYPAALQDLGAALAGDPNIASFIVKNALDTPKHVILTKSTDTALTTASLAWLTDMVTDKAWSSTILP